MRKVRTEIIVTKKESNPSLSAGTIAESYKAVSLYKSCASLTVAKNPTATLFPLHLLNGNSPVPKAFQTGRETITPSNKDIYLRSGFKPGHIYEFIYQAKNPLVLGLGFAVVRDLISFLRYQMKDATGKPNPLATAKQAISLNRSRFENPPLYLPPPGGE